MRTAELIAAGAAAVPLAVIGCLVLGALWPLPRRRNRRRP